MISMVPQPPIVDFSAIPVELRGHPQWVNWRYQKVTGRSDRTKVPLQTSGYNASTSAPETWGSYEDVQSAYADSLSSSRPFDGVGLVLTSGTGLLGIDLDGCRSPDGVQPWAREVLEMLGSTYVEASPSGTGLRAFVRGAIPEGARNRVSLEGRVGSVPGEKRPEFEWYVDRRYFTLTGAVYDGAPSTIAQPSPEALAAVWEYVSALGKKKKPTTQKPTHTDVHPVALSDDALLDKARNTANGAGFAALYDHGDTSAYGGDVSAATASLLCSLAFWTAKDQARMDRLFRGSALMRDKWDSPRSDSTWGALEIKSACALVTDTFTIGTNGAHLPQSPSTPSGPSQATEDEDGAPPLPLSGPTIPPMVYEQVPEDINAPCRLLREGHERDVFLTALFPVLSAAAPNVLTKYNRQWKALALNTAVIAPAGAGKSPLRLAGDCAEPIDARLRQASADERAEWTARGDDDRRGKQEPPERSLRLAVDTSTRGLLDRLAANDGRGLLFETEIKTLAETFRQEWGSFKSILLKAAEQEPIERLRKNEGKLYIRKPELPMAISGTPGGFSEWIRSTEDGVFSRFLFYVFDAKPVWVDQFSDEGDERLDKALANVGEILDDMHKALARRTVDEDGKPTPLYFWLDDEQKRRLNTAFAHCLRASDVAGRPELFASVKRGAFQAVRIAGVLALFRLQTTGKSLEIITSYTPYDSEVDAAISLVYCYLDHASALALSFERDPRAKIKREDRWKFFQQLPNDFTTAEAHDVGSKMSMSRSSVERALRALAGRHKLLTQPQYGRYRKVLSAVTDPTDPGVTADVSATTPRSPSLPSGPSTPSGPSAPSYAAASLVENGEEEGLIWNEPEETQA